MDQSGGSSAGGVGRGGVWHWAVVGEKETVSEWRSEAVFSKDRHGSSDSAWGLGLGTSH
jgi:hypothetical protein